MRKTIVIAALALFALIGSCSMSAIASQDSELKAVSQEFLQTVENSNNQYFDCNNQEDEQATTECGSPENPASILAGSLDDVLAKRNVVLKKKDILLIGAWSTGAFHAPFGYDSASADGFYIPLAPCRLDSLPVWMRSMAC